MTHRPDPPPTAAAADETLVTARRGFLAAGWAKFSDNAIPSLVVAVIAGLVLFFFNETGDSITRLNADIGDSITRLDADIDDRITRLDADIDDRITRLDADIDDRITRLDADIDDRITRLDAEHEARFIRLEENQQQIAVTLATLVGEFAAFREYVNNRFAAVDARLDAIEARLTRLEENQQEIAVTLARLVALVEAHFEAPATPSEHSTGLARA